MSDKRCKDCSAPTPIAAPHDFLHSYTCPNCGPLFEYDVEDVPNLQQRTQKRWEPGCEVHNVGLGDTPLYNVNFKLTKEQYQSLCDAMAEWDAHCNNHNNAAADAGKELCAMLFAAANNHK